MNSTQFAQEHYLFSLAFLLDLLPKHPDPSPKFPMIGQYLELYQAAF